MNSTISAARRRAESQLARRSKQTANVKSEEEERREALDAKTARLRELRLAKEAADRAAGVQPAGRKRPAK